MSNACKRFWTSNKWRNFSAIFCYSVALVLTLVMLVTTSTNVTDKVSWSDMEYEYRVDYDKTIVTEHYVVNIGLLTSRKCTHYDSSTPNWIQRLAYCADVPTNGVSGADVGNAGRGVITANSFGMFFAVISVLLLQLYIVMPKFAAKLKFPRVIIFISCFLMLTMFIVSVATWFKLAHDQLASSGVWETFLNGVIETRPTKVKAGYAIAVNIFIIALAFFAWLFTFLRVQFPNHAQLGEKSTENVGMTSEMGHAISMQYQPPPVALSPSQAMGAYNAYNNMNSPPSQQQKRGFFG